MALGGICWMLNWLYARIALGPGASETVRTGSAFPGTSEEVDRLSAPSEGTFSRSSLIISFYSLSALNEWEQLT